MTLDSGSYSRKGRRVVIVKRKNIARDLTIGTGGLLTRDVTDNLHRLVKRLLKHSSTGEMMVGTLSAR